MSWSGFNRNDTHRTRRTSPASDDIDALLNSSSSNNTSKRDSGESHDQDRPDPTCLACHGKGECWSGITPIRGRQYLDAIWCELPRVLVGPGSTIVTTLGFGIGIGLSNVNFVREARYTVTLSFNEDCCNILLSSIALCYAVECYITRLRITSGQRLRAVKHTMDEPVSTYEIPAECIGGVVVDEGPNFRIEVQNVPVPDIGPEDVLIKLNATGLCMSDVHLMLVDWASPPMSVFGTKCAGHEGAGVIVRVGERVKHLKVGMRAGYKPIQDTCGVCEQCKSGRDNYCAQAVVTGLMCDGSYKQYVKSPERYTTTIPDGVNDYVAGPVMCSASTIYTSIKEAALQPGQWACFPGGGGGVGIQGVQLAHAMGLRAVVVDSGSEREALAKEMGAEAFVDFKDGNPVEKIIDITGGGSHAVFVTAVQAYPIALDYLGTRVGAKVMCIGLPPKEQFHLDIDPTRLCLYNQSVKGTLVSGLADVDETLDFARRGKLRLQPTVIGLSGWNEAVQKLRKGEVAGRIVVDFNIP